MAKDFCGHLSQEDAQRPASYEKLSYITESNQDITWHLLTKLLWKQTNQRSNRDTSTVRVARYWNLCTLWEESKIAHPLWKYNGLMDWLYNWEIWLLCTYIKELESGSWTNISIPKFTASSLMISKKWKQPCYHQWCTKGRCRVYPVEEYSDSKMGNFTMCDKTFTDMKIIYFL